MPDTSIRELVDRLFSRNVLGSVFIGLTTGKVVEKTIILNTGGTRSELLAWTIALVFAVLLFLLWDRIEARTDEIVE